MSRTRRLSVERSCDSLGVFAHSVTHLHDVAGLVGDEQHVELFKRLIDESDI